MIEWPPHLARTEGSRQSTSRFRISLSRSFDELEETLGKMGVDDYRYSFDAPSRDRDGRPYARSRPEDPSFVLRWSKNGEQYAAGCDRYCSLRDNVRELGLWLEEKRKMEDRPVSTAESEFANARLPPGEEEIPVSKSPYEILGLSRGVSEEEIRDRYRELVHAHHPDGEGGDTEKLKEVKRAKDQLLE